MVWILPLEPNEANANETFARLTTPNSQTDVDQVTTGQFITNNLNTNKSNASPNSIIRPYNQCAIILQQFRIMAEELRNCTRQVSSDMTKMTQAHNTSQEHTGKLIENAISQALTKAQDTVTPSPPTEDTNI